MSLRGYQSACLEAVARRFEEGVHRQLFVLPTASGKATIIAYLPQYLGLQKGQQALVLVHRNDLVGQTAKRIQRYNPKMLVDTEQGANLANKHADIIVASVQSISRDKRLHRFDPDKFRIIFVDEAHVVPGSEQYDKVLKYFRVMKGESNLDDTKYLGMCTATPDRPDSKGLDAYVDEIVYSRDLLEMMNDGVSHNGTFLSYLADIKSFSVKTVVDLDEVKRKGGDFDIKDLERTVNNPYRNNIIVDEYIKHGENKPAICFTVDVQHAIDVAAAFNARGLKAHYVTGETPREERDILYGQLGRGELNCLASCGVMCLDEKTEILTDSGWVGIDSIKAEDKVANWDTGKIWFSKPIEIFKRGRMNGERMVSVRSEHCDLRVTEGHDLISVARPREDRWKKVKAGKLVGKTVMVPVSGDYSPEYVDRVVNVIDDKKTARKITALAYYYRDNCGMGRDESRAEAKKWTDHRNSLYVKSPSELTLEECELIGLFVGDGSTSSPKCGGSASSITQSLRYGKINDRIRELLNVCGIHYNLQFSDPPANGTAKVARYVMSNGTGGRDQHREGISKIRPYLTKKDFSFLYSLNSDQFSAFIIGLWMADGNHGQLSKPDRPAVRITTTTKALADTIQAVAVTRGNYCSINLGENPKKNIRHKQDYRVSIVFGKTTTTLGGGASPRVLSFDDGVDERVWCVKTESGNIVTRRNGRVCIMGNCIGLDLPEATVGLMARPTKSGLLFRQSCGRVLRPYPSPEEIISGVPHEWRKEYAIVIDFVDVTRKHKLVTTPTLFGLKQTFDAKGKRATQIVKQLEEAKDKKKIYDFEKFESMEAIKAFTERTDLLSAPGTPAEIEKISNLCWAKDREGYFISIPGGKCFNIKQNQLGRYDIYQSVNGVRSLAGSSHDLKDAIQTAERDVPADALVVLKRNSAWRSHGVTDKQIAYIARLNPSLRRRYNNIVEFGNYIRSTFKSSGEASNYIATLPKPHWGGYGSKPSV